MTVNLNVPWSPYRSFVVPLMLYDPTASVPVVVITPCDEIRSELVLWLPTAITGVRSVLRGLTNQEQVYGTRRGSAGDTIAQ